MMWGYEFTYNEKNQLIKKSSFYVGHETAYTYNKKGYVSGEITTYYNNYDDEYHTGKQTITYDYKYNRHKDWTRKIDKNFSEEIINEITKKKSTGCDILIKRKLEHY